MQIKNLSSAQTFGTVIASLPDDMPCTSHCCVRAGEPIKRVAVAGASRSGLCFRDAAACNL